MGSVGRDAGLIPAHAGKTQTAAVGPCSRRAHPRSRGENRDVVSLYRNSVGSSPLTRGKRARSARSPGAAGLIPAHAGKTRLTPSVPALPRAHPRSRGENGVGRARSTVPNGSSPLTRGKLAVVLGAAHAGGLIPAHAGKTMAGRVGLSGLEAHPRSRGENDVKTGSGLPVLGSSPLTRGKPAKLIGSADRGGLIPAHAGKTDRLVQDLPPARAHPRSRGENIPAYGLIQTSTGSSPLTRGKRLRKQAQQTRRRLIPAHAGKTH